MCTSSEWKSKNDKENFYNVTQISRNGSPKKWTIKKKEETFPRYKSVNGHNITKKLINWSKSRLMENIHGLLQIRKISMALHKRVMMHFISDFIKK